MKTNIYLFKLPPALVLGGFMIGCGGNSTSENKMPKGDGKKGGTQNKPKATKFTPEMVKEAFIAAQAIKSDTFTEESLAKIINPERLRKRTKRLNEAISDGKIEKDGIRVDEITTEALTKAIVSYEIKENEGIIFIRSENHASTLTKGLIAYEGDNDFKLPVADKWCDTVFNYVGTLAVFYSPQHPDAAKLKASLPKGERVSHYAFNKALSGKTTDDGNVVLVFECDLGWNGAGGLEDALKYMDKFKMEKIAVTTSDGTASSVTKEELKKFQWAISP